MDYEQLVQLAQDLKKRVETLERENNSLRVANNAARELFESTETVTDSDVRRQITVTVGEGSDSFFVLDYPDFWLPVNVNGKRFRVPVYDI